MTRLTANETLQATYRYISRRTWKLSDDDWLALAELEAESAAESLVD